MHSISRPVRNPSQSIINDGLKILCGPLLNYKGMQIIGSRISVWHGSVLVVARPGSAQPSLKLECLGVQSQTSQNDSPWPNDIDEPKNIRRGSIPNSPEAGLACDISGVKLYACSNKVFWRFSINLALQEQQVRWKYALTNVQSSGSELGTFPFRTFVVPSVSRTYILELVLRNRNWN